MTSAAFFLLMVFGQTPTRFIAVSGQSLSTGCGANTALSTVQVGGNVTLTGNTLTGCSNYNGQLVPWPTVALVESTVETPRSAIANTYYTRTGNSVVVVSNGVTATTYSGLKRGTTPWTYLDYGLTHWGSRVTGDAVLGLVLIHGEGDRLSSTYLNDMLEWQSDFNNNARAHTSSRLNHPIWISQSSSCTFYSGTSLTTCVGLYQQYLIARLYPTRAKLVGPKYQYTYSDGVHLNNASSKLLGEQIGYAVSFGDSWQPLWPRLGDVSVSRSSNVVTLYLHTPSPPLVVDTTTVTGLGAARGFEYTDDSSPPSITSVDCSAACSGNICSCQITLSGTPTGANKKLRYAWTGTSGNWAGPTTGMRGNIRDSDTFQYNWLVHFEESVP